mgnify:CR=1
MQPSISTKKSVCGQLEENKNNNIKSSYLMIKVGTWGKNKKQIHFFIAGMNLKLVKKHHFV